jgi:hypothetical protein
VRVLPTDGINILLKDTPAGELIVGEMQLIGDIYPIRALRQTFTAGVACVSTWGELIIPLAA